MGLKKSGSNADFSISASMTNGWEPPSKKRGPKKGKEKLWTAGGRMDFGSCLCYAKQMKAQRGGILLPA